MKIPMKKVIAVVLLLCPAALCAQSGTGTVSGDSLQNLSPLFLGNPDPPIPVVVNKPKTWKQVFTDPKIIGFLTTTMASSLVATYEINKCRARKNAGIAFCDGGYGEEKAREIVRNAGQAGLDLISVWGYKRGDLKYQWFLPGGLYAGYNLSVAIRQSEMGCDAGTWPVYGVKFLSQAKSCIPWTWKNKDLSNVQFVKH